MAGIGSAGQLFDTHLSPAAVYDVQISAKKKYEQGEMALLREILDDAIFTIQKGIWLHEQGLEFPRVNSYFTESDFESAVHWITSDDEGFSPNWGWTFLTVCAILQVNAHSVRKRAFCIKDIPDEVFKMRRDLVRERRGILTKICVE